MAKKTKRTKKVKAPVTPNLTPRLTPEQIIANAEKSPKPLTASGIGYHRLAGSPSKDQVVATFSKAGYSLSWVARAAKLGITPEELCAAFAADRKAVAARWQAATEKKTTETR